MKLDGRCCELMQIVRKKGGAIREQTNQLPTVQEDTDIATKREIALKCLTFNMGEAVEDLKDFLCSFGKKSAESGAL
ncbi:unnamed protein product [Arctogadus glacialis]